MEIDEKNVELSGSNSSNEDLSQYTDADESMSAPTEILAEVRKTLNFIYILIWSMNPFPHTHP